METQNIVQRDLDTFDAKFGSGDATMQCTTVADDRQEAGRLSRCDAAQYSDIDRDQRCGRQMSMLEADNTSRHSSAAEPVASLTSRFAVPSGSFQFQADWKRLKNCPEEFYIYFKVTAISRFC